MSRPAEPTPPTQASAAPGLAAPVAQIVAPAVLSGVATDAPAPRRPMDAGFWEIDGDSLEGCKYVLGRRGDGLRMWVFHRLFAHLEIAQRKLDPTDLVSAGFIRLGADGDWECHGESESTRLKARPEDTDLLRGYLRAPKRPQHARHRAPGTAQD